MHKILFIIFYSIMKIKKSQNLRENKILRSGKRVNVVNKHSLDSKISKNKSNRKRSWKNCQMKQAIEMVKLNGSKLLHAANSCRVPLSTLATYIKQGFSIDQEDSDEEVCSEIIEEMEDDLSEAVSDNGIETISVSSSNVTSTSKTSYKDTKKFVLLARKSTSPFRLLLKDPCSKKPCEDILQNYELEKNKDKQKKEELTSSRDQFTNTDNFIDSIVLDKNKLAYLSGFESKFFYIFFFNLL